MAIPLMITTFRRRAFSTWPLRLREGMQIFVKTLHWQGTQSSLGWQPLRQVSTSPDKSPPHKTSLRLARQVRLRLACGPIHTARARPPTRAGRRISTSRGDDSWRPCRRPAPARALNASLTSHATITSPSTSTLPHTKLILRHSSTLYDARGPRLRLTRGKSSKYSGRLRQDQTTQGEGQVSRGEQPDPATRRLPQQDIKTKLQCSLTDDDVQRDVPVLRHCSSFFLPFVPLLL
jgi:hypothetical protein